MTKVDISKAIQNNVTKMAAQARATPPSSPVKNEKHGLSPKAAALAALPTDWREQLLISASEMGIKAEDDLGWLLVAAFINAWAGAAASGKAADTTREAVGKIQGEVLAGARAAGKDVAGAIEQAGANVRQEITAHLEAPNTGILSAIKNALTAGTGQGLTDVKVDLVNAQRQAERVIQTIPEKVHEAVQVSMVESKNAAAKSFEEAAKATLDRFAREKSIVWGIGGAFAALAIGSVGMGYGYIIGSSRYPWWTHSFASAFFRAPMGILLLPMGGFLAIEVGKDYGEFDWQRRALRYIGLFLLSVGLLLPALSFLPVHWLAGLGLLGGHHNG